MQFGLFGDVYVGDNFCRDELVLKVLGFLGYVLFLVKLFIPIFIVIVGSIDLYKAVVSNKNDELASKGKTLGVRIIIGILIFFIPTIINSIIGQLENSQLISNESSACRTCLLSPFDCEPKQCSATNDEITRCSMQGGVGCVLEGCALDSNNQCVPIGCE